MSGFDVRRFDPPLTVPTIFSGPVLLRPFVEDDAELVMEASSDVAITQASSITPHGSALAARAFVERQGTLAQEGQGYSLVAVLTEEPDRAIGSVALWLRDIEAGQATVGYWLLDAARGRGLGSWALRGLVRYGIEELEIPRLEVVIHPHNEASIRTATSVGFAFSGRQPTSDEADDSDDSVALRLTLDANTWPSGLQSPRAPAPPIREVTKPNSPGPR